MRRRLTSGELAERSRIGASAATGAVAARHPLGALCGVDRCLRVGARLQVRPRLVVRAGALQVRLVRRQASLQPPQVPRVVWPCTMDISCRSCVVRQTVQLRLRLYTAREIEQRAA